MPKSPAAATSGPSLTWLLGEVARAAERLPGMAIAQQAFGSIEKGVLGALKARLDELDEPPSPSRRSAASSAPESPATMLADLMERSLVQQAADSRRYHFVFLLRQLVPDEVRILAALSDDTSYPLIHVGYSSALALGQMTERILANVSTVGRAAGVMLPDVVPNYVTHLKDLGLVETGDELAGVDEKYDILETDTAVREALRRAKEAGRHTRVLRRSLRISALGRTLWNACQEGPT